MTDPRTSLGIAIACIYAIVWSLAGFLLFHRHGRPRMAWSCLFTFSMFRIASGVLIALYPQNEDNVPLIIVAIITLNAGVIPLLLCIIGFLRIMHTLDFPNHDRLGKNLVYSRIGFLIGIALLIAGGALQGEYTDANLVSIGRDLGKAAYLIIAAVLALMAVFEVWMWRRLAVLGQASMYCLVAITAAMPFMIVRITYALLGIFNPTETRWNALSSAVGPFVGMAFIMELVVVAMFLTVGFVIPPMKERAHGAQANSADGDKIAV